MIIVADPSPLIALARVGRLDSLRSVFGSVLLPTAVWAELVQVGMDRPGAAAVMTADWIGRREIVDVGLAALLRRGTAPVDPSVPGLQRPSDATLAS